MNKPIVIIRISLLKANAPKTPSSEKDASISSKYKKPTSPEHLTVSAQSLALSYCLFSSHSASPSINKYTAIPARPDLRTLIC